MSWLSQALYLTRGEDPTPPLCTSVNINIFERPLTFTRSLVTSLDTPERKPRAGHYVLRRKSLKMSPTSKHTGRN